MEREWYYILRSNLQIERSALLDDVISRVSDLESGGVFIEGFFQNKFYKKFDYHAKRKGKLLYHVSICSTIFTKTIRN